MAKQTTRAGMDVKEKMYLVLVLCFAAVLITVGAAFFIVRGLGSTTRQNDNTADSAATQEPLVADSSYDKNQNTIDTNKYSSTILEESADAGQSYVDETLFLGDSNTARMYRYYSYCKDTNAIGSVGMSGKALATYACAKFEGYSGYKTMPEAVALMQPRRVILTFGTNDLSPSYSASSFVSDYAKGIKAVQDAYPSVDIIVNAIPPLGQQHSNQNLTQTQVDEYNKALVQMCQDNGWKFLNSAEVLKDSSTGYAKSGYVSNDGIHLTEQAMDALFTYIRTHSYITEDTRPALTAIPVRDGKYDKDVSGGSSDNGVVSAPTATAKPEATEEPDEDSASATDGPDWADGTSGSYATATPDPEYTYWSEIIAPTCTEQGYTYYHCNEDSSKDYKSEYVNALGHDFQNGYCTRCGAQDPNAVTQEPTQEPTATEAPAPDAPADSGTSGSEDTPNWASENSDSTPEA